VGGRRSLHNCRRSATTDRTLWRTAANSCCCTSSSSSHTFLADGTYTVTLTVTDGWGKAASTTRDITIGKPLTNVAPTPVINPVVCVDRACTFYGVSSSDPNGDAFTYLWNFGDGTATSTAVSPVHTFTLEGDYTVTLTVTDSDGLAGRRSVLVFPDKVDLAFDTVPTGLTLVLDGISRATPFVHDTLKAFHHVLDAPDQTTGLDVGRFVSWSDGGARRHEIVVPEDSDPTIGRISPSSPIGKCLLGHAVGDSVEVRVPAGTKTYEVTNLVTIHDQVKDEPPLA